MATSGGLSTCAALSATFPGNGKNGVAHENMEIEE